MNALHHFIFEKGWPSNSSSVSKRSYLLVYLNYFLIQYNAMMSKKWYDALYFTPCKIINVNRYSCKLVFLFHYSFVFVVILRPPTHPFIFYWIYIIMYIIMTIYNKCIYCKECLRIWSIFYDFVVIQYIYHLVELVSR